MLLLAVVFCAQAQVGVTTGAVLHKWMGFQPAAPLVGVDVNTDRFSNTGWWSPAVKSYVGDGWTGWEQGAVYFNHGAFGAGPAALLRYTSNSEYAKTSFYPSAAIQCRASKWRVEAFLHFRDQWTRNHGRGASLAVRRELTTFARGYALGIRGGVTVMKFSDGLSDPFGSVTQFGLVFYHRSRTQD